MSFWRKRDSKASAGDGADAGAATGTATSTSPSPSLRGRRFWFRGRQSSEPDITLPAAVDPEPGSSVNGKSTSASGSQRADGGMVAAASRPTDAHAPTSGNQGRPPLVAVPSPSAARKTARSNLAVAATTIGRRKSIADSGDASMAHLRKLYDGIARVSTTRTVTYSALCEELKRVGILPTDNRLVGVLDADKVEAATMELSFDDFASLVTRSRVINRALSNDLILQDFQATVALVRLGAPSTAARESRAAALTAIAARIAGIGTLFEKSSSERGGAVATYIPQLATVPPEQFGVALCSVDGQQASFGDAATLFCLQSCSKPITYCIASELNGLDTVHTYVGREPSGRNFNELVLDHNNRPHNPLINSGAIVCTSLIHPEKQLSDRFDLVLRQWQELNGGTPVAFSNATYLSERATANRNHALAHLLREAAAISKSTDLQATLDLYFMFCSIEMTCQQVAVVAATLANDGVCPTTGRRVFRRDTVRNCLSLMASCGMYEHSGEFAFTMGFPAKSGVAGGLMIVIPNVAGFCTWSPRLDRQGNSVRGIAFCRELVTTFRVHLYDSILGNDAKKLSLQSSVVRVESAADSAIRLRYSAARGQLDRVQALVARNVDVNEADYDGRTALHVAACEGHLHIVEYLLRLGADVRARDRFRHTALEDAQRCQHRAIVELLERHGQSGKAQPQSLVPQFRSIPVLGQPDGTAVAPRQVGAILKGVGLAVDSDPRFSTAFKQLPAAVTEGDFVRFLGASPVLARAFEGRLAVSNFSELRADLTAAYTASEHLTTGTVPSFPPLLASSSPTTSYSLAACTVDGQVCANGNAADSRCIYSLAKVVVYLLALEEHGLDKVHERVGREPSGRNLNDLILDHRKLPYNPLVNSGAILCTALIRASLPLADRFVFVNGVFERLVGRRNIRFNNNNYLSEKELGYRYYALGYLLQERNVFPPGTDLESVISLYVMMSSIELSTEDVARIAATLANGGVQPYSGDRIFTAANVRSCLALMATCGMYQYSGEWSFSVGLPAKSAVNGTIMVVIPNVMGVCVHSPLVDTLNNSVRGIDIFKRLVQVYAFHAFESSTTGGGKKNARQQTGFVAELAQNALCQAAAIGDVSEIHRLVAVGADVNLGDYDGRTALHLAVTERHRAAVQVLLQEGAVIECRDRWGLTPADYAASIGATDLVHLLLSDHRR